MSFAEIGVDLGKSEASPVTGVIPPSAQEVAHLIRSRRVVVRYVHKQIYAEIESTEVGSLRS